MSAIEQVTVSPAIGLGYIAGVVTRFIRLTAAALVEGYRMGAGLA